MLGQLTPVLTRVSFFMNKKTQSPAVGDFDEKQ